MGVLLTPSTLAHGRLHFLSLNVIPVHMVLKHIHAQMSMIFSIFVFFLWQLRLAYSDQREEIVFLETQLRAKDAKITQLEKENQYLREKTQRWEDFLETVTQRFCCNVSVYSVPIHKLQVECLNVGVLKNLSSSSWWEIWHVKFTPSQLGFFVPLILKILKVINM